MSVLGAEENNRKVKRTLDLLSPLSASKEKKAKSKSSDESFSSVGEMDKGDHITDTLAIHEAISVSLKSALEPLATTNETVAGLVPALATAVATAVAVAMEEVMRNIITTIVDRLQPINKPPPADPRIVATLRRLTYDNDRQQQYSRRESVRISGVTQESNESPEQLEKKVMRVMTDAGVKVKPDDISAMHRAGKPRSGPKAILVRFVSRRTRAELMKKKKTLKEKNGYDRVYINDDLTPLRARLLGYVKTLEGVQAAWTIDGRIHCQPKYPPGLAPELRPKQVHIETPDDLHRLGVTRVDYARLGLSHLDFDGLDSAEVD